MLSQILVFALLVVVISSKSIDESLFREETERIINGQDAKPGQFPWAVSLYYNRQFICTASILSPYTVLTAAHCVYLFGEYQPADSFYAIANVSRSAQSVRINFANLMGHINYNEGEFDNDVAVFRTSEPIPFSGEVKPICIAGPNTKISKYATAMGWGKTGRNNESLPDRLQYVEQKIVWNSLCSFVNAGVNDNKLCSKGLIGSFSGVCNGDSGGPLVQKSDKDNKQIQIGITSYINGLVGCGTPVPAVFTRVSSYVDFIMQESGDDSICIA